MVIIDFKIASEANAFFEVGEKEYLSHKKINSEKDMYATIPAIVNLAFSIELFLKCMLDEKVRGHDLNKLFHSLPDNDRNAIMQLTITHMKTWGFECDEKDFWNYLDKNKLVFKEWRYFYQRGKTVNIVFLLALGCSLRNLINLTKELGGNKANTKL